LHSLWCSSLWQGSQVLRQKRNNFQLLLRLFLVYWNIMAARVHRPLTLVAFNANGIGRQAHELRKQMQDLKIDVALFSETHLKPHMRLYIPNYHIYRNDRQEGHKGELPLQLKRKSHILMLTCLSSFQEKQRGSAYRLDILECCMHLFINLHLERGEKQTLENS
jgi:hypothetical protein